ncbi:MAG TPA: response regulator [Nitrospirota bacterium]|nr:response regulator [Nitrospirota bacterium]
MRKRRAVVIDDEEIIVHVLKDFLSTRNYEVFSYTRPVVCPIFDKKGNLCNANYLCADVILTDFTLPGMNGLELLQEQSAHGCKLTSENKAVMSGYIEEESHKQIKRLGYAFIPKPIEFSRLSAWLDECEKRVDLSRPLGSRRKEMRHATCYEVRCQVDRTNEILYGMTMNISDSGLCLKLAAPLTTKQTVHIDAAHAIIACRTASVQWVSRNQDGSYLAGLSCVN